MRLNIDLPIVCVLNVCPSTVESDSLLVGEEQIDTPFLPNKDRRRDSTLLKNSALSVLEGKLSSTTTGNSVVGKEDSGW